MQLVISHQFPLNNIHSQEPKNIHQVLSHTLPAAAVEAVVVALETGRDDTCCVVTMFAVGSNTSMVTVAADAAVDVIFGWGMLVESSAKEWAGDTVFDAAAAVKFVDVVEVVETAFVIGVVEEVASAFVVGTLARWQLCWHGHCLWETASTFCGRGSID